MKHLVIVESPTKARTISRFLGAKYEIKATIGHIMDLPKSKIGIDFENDFFPLYEVVSDRKKVISELKKLAKDAQSIILATDPDREGETIAAHVADILGSSSKFKIQSSKFRRIVFHEITQEAIQEALKNPRDIDTRLVNAQTARRVLDRLVGYKLSPLLWKKVRRGLSAGRVQSVTLRLIVEREREIERFRKENYWTISVILSKAKDLDSSSQNVGTQNDKGTVFELIEINGEKIEVQNKIKLYNGEYKYTKTIIEKEEDAKDIVKDLHGKSFVVSNVLEKETRRIPQPPYTTSTLQQDAARRLGLNGRRSMSLAQKLYEEGYITYHRTDSVAISSSAMFNIINFVKKEYGEKYLPPKPRFYKARQKLAQEAHEAIRPTSVGQVLSIKYKVLSIVGEQGWRFYEMVWKRAVASQMADAVIESTTVYVDSKVKSEKLKVKNEGSNYKFKAGGSVLVFDGFLKVNPQALPDNILPEFNKAEVLHPSNIEIVSHETLPPPRYNDASLIKTLEEEGIGRPSTYATIVSTIEGRSYIERTDGRFVSTSVGTAVNDFLVANFSDIDDIPFTATIEDELDNIAKGEGEWVHMMRNFYTPFEKKLGEVEGAGRVKIPVEETGEKCPDCKKGNLVIRTGRFGKFLACSRFPECKFTKALVETTNLICPKDRGKIVIKKTRKGRKFYGCSNYPACTFAAWKIKDIKKITP